MQVLIANNLFDNRIRMRISDNLTPHHIPALKLPLFGMLICSVVNGYMAKTKQTWLHFYPSFWNCLAKVDTVLVINTM